MEISWDKYFMSLTYFIAMKSKDEKTHCGTVIVGQDNEILATGYNSFPRGIDDNRQERQERPEKYFWFEHGERNAVYNAVRNGVSLKGSRAYITAIPCMDCARALVQSGVKEVIYHNLDYDRLPIWEEHHKRTLVLLKESGVKIREYTGELIGKITALKNEKVIEL